MSDDHVDDDDWEPAESPGFLLWNLENHWQREQRRVLALFELTVVQFLLLSGLKDVGAESGMSQIELARRCRTDPMMTSQIVRLLAKEGLIERIRQVRDKRAFNLRLSEDGRALQRRAASAVRAVETQFFAALGADLPAFSDALRFLAGERPRRRVQAVSRST